jgi:hypothetical protein
MSPVHVGVKGLYFQTGTLKYTDIGNPLTSHLKISHSKVKELCHEVGCPFVPPEEVDGKLNANASSRVNCFFEMQCRRTNGGLHTNMFYLLYQLDTDFMRSKKETGNVAQVVECLLSKCETPGFSPQNCQKNL